MVRQASHSPVIQRAINKAQQMSINGYSEPYLLPYKPIDLT